MLGGPQMMLVEQVKIFIRHANLQSKRCESKHKFSISKL